MCATVAFLVILLFLLAIDFKTFIHLHQTVFRHTQAAPPTASTRYPPIVARPARVKLLRTGKEKTINNKHPAAARSGEPWAKEWKVKMRFNFCGR